MREVQAEMRGRDVELQAERMRLANTPAAKRARREAARAEAKQREATAQACARVLALPLSSKDKARMWLGISLRGGSRRATELFAEYAAGLGMTPASATRAVQSAAKTLRVVRNRGEGGVYWWKLRNAAPWEPGEDVGDWLDRCAAKPGAGVGAITPVLLRPARELDAWLDGHTSRAHPYSAERLALRLWREMLARLRYIATWRMWLALDRSTWRELVEDRVERLVRDWQREVRREFATTPEGAEERRRERSRRTKLNAAVVEHEQATGRRMRQFKINRAKTRLNSITRGTVGARIVSPDTHRALIAAMRELLDSTPRATHSGTKDRARRTSPVGSSA